MATRAMADGVACLVHRRWAKAAAGQGSTAARGALRLRGARRGAWARAGAARGVQQLGSGDGATNKRGNSWNAMEQGKHEHQCNSYLRFELLDEEDDGRS